MIVLNNLSQFNQNPLSFKQIYGLAFFRAVVKTEMIQFVPSLNYHDKNSTAN